MRKLLSTTLIFSIVFLYSPFTVHAANDIVNDLSTNLIGCWELDEESGNRADSSANGNNLVEENTVGFTTGIIDNAADFENNPTDNGESLTLSDASQGTDFDAIYGTDGEFTASAWVQTEVSGDFNIIGSEYLPTGNNRSWYFMQDGASDQLEITFSGDGSSAGVWLSDTGSFTFDTTTTYHVFVHVDTSTDPDTVEAWVDGSPVTMSFDAGSDNQVGIFDTSAEFNISGRDGNLQGWDGWIDVFAIWSGDKTANVADVYASGNGIPCVADVVEETPRTFVPQPW